MSDLRDAVGSSLPKARKGENSRKGTRRAPGTQDSRRHSRRMPLAAVLLGGVSYSRATAAVWHVGGHPRSG